MHPTYYFKVNLLDQSRNVFSTSQPDKNFNNILQQLEFATVTVDGVDQPLKHGDVFTLSGEKAIRLKKMVDAGQLSFTLDTYDIPDVEGVDGESSLLEAVVTWDASDTFYTYIEIKLDDGQWEFAQLKEISDDTATIPLEEGGTLYVRLRHTDNEGNFSTNYTTTSVEVPEPELPVVTTDDLDFGFAANVDATGTVVSEGSSDLTEYGFVWGEEENPTVEDDNVVIVGDSSFTGEFEDTITGLTFGPTLYFRAYATNSEGTGYGENLSGEAFICLMEGTKITLPNGSKKNIETVTYEDQLLVWNFDDGKLDQAKTLWMVRPFVSSRCALVKFSDGSELGTVVDGKGHRIFNREKGAFTHLMSDDTPIGTTTFNENGDVVSVISKEIVERRTTFYNVITDTHINVYANTILTSTGLNNIYPISNMRFVKDERTTRAKEEFRGVSESMYVGLRLAEQPQDYKGIKSKIARMIKRQW